ncbi:MAG: hypothetical protein ACOX3T_01695 [Bdellovibrionota bacterium]
MNSISNILNTQNGATYNPISSYSSQLGQTVYHKPYYTSLANIGYGPATITPMPTLTDNSSTNFIQNFVNQMLNIATNFVQNMFSIVGLQLQNIYQPGGSEITLPTGQDVDISGIANSGENLGFLGGLKNMISSIFSGSNSSSWLTGLLSSAQNLIGNIFGSSSSLLPTNNDGSKCGSLFSNIWDGIKNIAGNLFGGSKSAGTEGTGSIFSNIWSGIKNIFSSNSDSGFSFSNILGTVCSLFK